MTKNVELSLAKRLTSKVRRKRLDMCCERQKDRCAYCGGLMYGAVDDTGPSLEHLVARREGGSNHTSNLAAAHRKCNLLRSNMPHDEAWSLLTADTKRIITELREECPGAHLIEGLDEPLIMKTIFQDKELLFHLKHMRAVPHDLTVSERL